MPHANLSVFIPHAGCPAACVYCDQRRITGSARPPAPAEVEETLRLAAARYRGDPRDAEIAFFGGSFTAVPRAYMLSLLQTAQAVCRENGFFGIRCSTRPDALSAETLDILRAYGVTSIEIGAESMDDAVLLQSGRGHTAADVESAAQRVKAGGFRLGLQMMTGLPGDTDAGAVETAEKLIALGPAEMRVYPTLVFRGTALYDEYLAGRYAPQTLESAVALCAVLIDKIEGAGIRLLRVGLHDSPEAKHCAAGPYHPAFRELCLSKLFLDALLPALLPYRGRDVRVAVAPNMCSAAAGHGGRNKKELSARAIRVHFVPDETLSGRTFRILEGEEVDHASQISGASRL